MTKTFQNPSQVDKSPSDFLFKCEKCEKCDFALVTSTDLVSHNEEKHNWCSFCSSRYHSPQKPYPYNTSRKIGSDWTHPGEGPR